MGAPDLGWASETSLGAGVAGGDHRGPSVRTGWQGAIPDQWWLIHRRHLPSQMVGLPRVLRQLSNINETQALSRLPCYCPHSTVTIAPPAKAGRPGSRGLHLLGSRPFQGVMPSPETSKRPSPCISLARAVCRRPTIRPQTKPAFLPRRNADWHLSTTTGLARWGGAALATCTLGGHWERGLKGPRPRHACRRCIGGARCRVGQGVPLNVGAPCTSPCPAVGG